MDRGGWEDDDSVGGFGAGDDKALIGGGWGGMRNDRQLPPRVLGAKSSGEWGELGLYSGAWRG